jgi:hypothetical protein
MEYTILDFSLGKGTMTVSFKNHLLAPQAPESSPDLLDQLPATKVLNYNAPRKNGVYLEGDELDDYICMLAGEQLSGALTQEELDQMVEEMSTDDPATITGGQDIMAKYVEYLEAQGTPPEVIEVLKKI